MLLLPGAALAHGEYRDSRPTAGEPLGAPPDEAWVEFTEPPTPDSHLEVVDPCGERVDTGNYLVSGDRVTVPLSAQAAGRYVVRYFMVSTIDGHPTRGSFSFRVSQGPRCARGAAAPGNPGDGGGGGRAGGQADPIEIGDLLLALGLAALIGAAGGHVYAGVIRPRGP